MHAYAYAHAHALWLPLSYRFWYARVPRMWHVCSITLCSYGWAHNRTKSRARNISKTRSRCTIYTVSYMYMSCVVFFSPRNPNAILHSSIPRLLLLHEKRRRICFCKYSPSIFSRSYIFYCTSKSWMYQIKKRIEAKAAKKG